jgi:hypothetical protein
MAFVHGAYAAGKLSCGFWDHWVPGANEPLAKLCREWADREKVELTVDFITSQGDKLALTATAEGLARSGHDILQLSDWYAAAQADNLEPVDDLVTTLVRRRRQPEECTSGFRDVLRFAQDSALEGDGFELSVPGQGRHPSATANHLFSHHLSPKLG